MGLFRFLDQIFHLVWSIPSTEFKDIYLEGSVLEVTGCKVEE
jgi:hypothetical protein